jgi:molecular chaperone HtpG
MAQEKMQFQTEVSRLLDIVANALYSNQEIFLRELISNASDACDKLRYLSLTDGDLLKDDSELKIRLTVDKDAKTLTIADNGIGMNRDDLIANLGTIAKSGTLDFLKNFSKDKKDVSQIGQFGVGFYSSFMVSEKVTVNTRRAGEDQTWTWTSDGQGEYTIDEGSSDVTRGTSVTLHLKDDASEYLEDARLSSIVGRYSDHIQFPVVLKGEEEDQSLNSASALWTRSKSDISEEQYEEFYRHTANAFDSPWLTMHNTTEGVIEYTSLLYVPSQAPFDLFQPERKIGVQLFVQRVFITDECQELLPGYLRFVRGIVDSSDLPLNISRELLQDNPVLRKIRSGLTKRILSELKKKAEKDAESYLSFWAAFGAVIKEGLYEDFEQRDTLLGLTRFSSSTSDQLTSLADYTSRMKEGQNAIFYITGESLEAIKNSPHLEGFKSKGVEVLLMIDPVDDFWLGQIGEFDGKSFKSITRGAADLDEIKSETEDDKKEEKKEAPNVAAVLELFKLGLGDKIKDVRVTQRLTDSPVCLVADDGDIDIHLARILKQHKQLNESQQRILEVNPNHPIIMQLKKKLDGGTSASDLEDYTEVLYGQAIIQEGESLPDPASFTKKLNKILASTIS